MTAPVPESAAARPVRSPRAVLGLGVVAAVAAVLTWPLWRPAVLPAQPPPAPAVQALPPRPVETVPLAEGTGIRSVLLIGQVESSQQATIRAQTSGIVQDIRVQPGDRITPGTLLAVLDDTDQKLALARAQAQLAEARSQLARLEAGTRREIIARRQAELRSAQARDQHEALQTTREVQTTEAFRQQYAARAGVESTHEQAIRRCGLRQCRYIGLAKTHLQHIVTAVAINLIRVGEWLAGTPIAPTRCSRFAALQGAV